MNKKNKATDNSTPYRTLGMNKVTAPKRVQDDPKSKVLKSDTDLRMRGKKA